MRPISSNRHVDVTRSRPCAQGRMRLFAARCICRGSICVRGRVTRRGRGAKTNLAPRENIPRGPRSGARQQGQRWAGCTEDANRIEASSRCFSFGARRGVEIGAAAGRTANTNTRVTQVPRPGPRGDFDRILTMLLAGLPAAGLAAPASPARDDWPFFFGRVSFAFGAIRRLVATPRLALPHQCR